MREMHTQSVPWLLHPDDWVRVSFCIKREEFVKAATDEGRDLGREIAEATGFTVAELTVANTAFRQG